MFKNTHSKPTCIIPTVPWLYEAAYLLIERSWGPLLQRSVLLCLRTWPGRTWVY